MAVYFKAYKEHIYLEKISLILCETVGCGLG